MQMQDLTAAKQNRAYEIWRSAMSRLDIADYLGLTIETVCRVLSEMNREGIVKITDARHLMLRDITALETLADGGD